MPADGLVLGLDRDESAIVRARNRLQGHDATEKQWKLQAATYAKLPEILEEYGSPKVDCILLDLGLSSDQLESRDRGFSFRHDAPLDLRFDQEGKTTAADLLAYLPEEKLANIIYEYGEERFSRRIASAIVERRRINPVRTTKQLYDLIHSRVPGQTHGRIDAATRTFQALRIAVNEELEHVKMALQRLPDCLAEGGRLLIISFHSLEDRLVKNAFRDDPRLEVLTKKPVVASDEESRRNPRSRSAKLRVAMRKA